MGKKSKVKLRLIKKGRKTPKGCKRVKRKVLLCKSKRTDRAASAIGIRFHRYR